MGDNLNPVTFNSGPALATLAENRFGRFVRIVHIYFVQFGRLSDHFEDVMVRAAQQAVRWPTALYDVKRVGPWRTVARMRGSSFLTVGAGS